MLKIDVNTAASNSELIEINPTDYINDPDKLDFLGEYGKADSPVKLLRSTNQAKIDDLVRAVNSVTCWENPIFDDRNLPYYALSAYLLDKITREQISHILEFYELKLTYPDLISIPMLTAQGSFTRACEQYFTSVLNTQRSSIPNVTREHLEKFRVSLVAYRQKAAPSFCFLHMRPDHGFFSGHVGISRYVITDSDSYKMGLVYFPGPVRNLFFPAITPKNSTTTLSIGKLGKFSIDMIETGHRKNIRINALAFPGAFRTTIVHNYNTTQLDATTHDVSHQGALSYFPERLYHMSLHCLDVIRDMTKIKWSEELWALVDMFVIDGNVNVLNKTSDYSISRTYSANEELSEEQSVEWISKLLKGVLSAEVFNMIILEMINNKDFWKKWINVDDFIARNTNKQTNDALQTPLTFLQLINHEKIGLQLKNGFVAKWKSITDSALGTLIRFEKNSRNKIVLCLFGKELDQYTNEELKSLLTDINDNNMTGIALVNAADTGDLEEVKKVLKPSRSRQFPKYFGLALRIASKNGHENCLAYLVTNYEIDSEADYYKDALKDAVISGHGNCLKLLFDNGLAAVSQKTFELIFIAAVKHKKTESLNFLISQDKYKISDSLLEKAVLQALHQDNSSIAETLFALAARTNRLPGLFNDCGIHDMLLRSPVHCISLIIDTFVGHSDLTYQDMFKSIAKNGNIECATQFINAVNKRHVQGNGILSLCMLEGFSSVNPRNSFTQPYNLHHEMVALQIDQYLNLSAINQSLSNQNLCPSNNDIDRLLDKIFTTSYGNNNVFIHTICDIVLYYLIHHALIKENPHLNDYCINKAVNKALHHQEPYYLRLLVKAGASLTLTSGSPEGLDIVNGVLIQDLPSAEVRCLVYLLSAINEMQQASDNESKIKRLLEQAALQESFEKEVFSLIYGASLKLKVHTLRHFVRYFDDDKMACLKTLIIERAGTVHASDLLSSDQVSQSVFKQTEVKIPSVKQEEYNAYI